jgi:hypothetical protein
MIGSSFDPYSIDHLLKFQPTFLIRESLLRRMKYSLSLIRPSLNKPPIFLRFRSSEALIISTVALAIFTDIFLYGVWFSYPLSIDQKEIIPILPFALQDRVGIEHDSVQSSVSILLAMYAAGLIAASPIVGWTAGNPIIWIFSR